MDKLEQYLDQVCHSIGGPRSLRQHVKQELREHLRDASAEHERAGLSTEEAQARALEDFGGPEQVRSDLEATHGYRVLPVVIDKAMQWKEKTMKAKWLWTSWAYLVLLGVIAVVTSALAQYVFSGSEDSAELCLTGLSVIAQGTAAAFALRRLARGEAA